MLRSCRGQARAGKETSNESCKAFAVPASRPLTGFDVTRTPMASPWDRRPPYPACGLILTPGTGFADGGTGAA